MSNETLSHQYKLLRPLLDRAAEIQAIDPLTAYYARMCAVQEGIKITNRHPDITALMKKVMSEMEAEKPKLAMGGPDADRYHVEAFAMKVFAGADKLDRAGRRDETVMKRYFASVQFFRVLEQFGPLDDQLDKMRKYAGYRAVVIHKALKTGEECPPPPEAGDLASEQLALEQELDAATLSATQAPAPPVADAAEPPPPPPPGAPAGTFALGSGLTTNDAAAAGAGPLSAPAAMPAIIQQGSKVLFRAHDSAPVEHGTVIQTRHDSASIALPDRLERSAAPGQLAPLIEAGYAVLYNPPDNNVQEAIVTGVHTEVWPPAYTIQLQNGSERNTEHTSFLGVRVRANAPPPPPLPTQPSTDSFPDASHGPQLASLPSTTSSTFTNNQEFPYPLVTAPSSPSRYPLDAPSNTSFGGSQGAVQPHTPSASPTAYGAPPPPPPLAAQAPSGRTFQAPFVSTSYHHQQQQQQLAVPSAVPGFVPSTQAVALATKKARECISSLNFQDIDSAVSCLRIALNALTTPNAGS